MTKKRPRQSSSTFFCQSTAFLVIWTVANLLLSGYLVERSLEQQDGRGGSSGSSESSGSDRAMSVVKNKLSNFKLGRGGGSTRGLNVTPPVGRVFLRPGSKSTAAIARINNQRQGYVPATVVIAATVRNVRPKQFAIVIPKLRKLGSYFTKYHILIYENNSRKEYRKAYRRELDKVPGDSTFVSEDVTASKFAHPDDTNRTVQSATYADKSTRLAMARNKLLGIVQTQFAADYEYMMISDLDHACGDDNPDIGYSPSVMREAFALHGNEWDVLTFKYLPYWDIWAFRQKAPLQPAWYYNMYGPFKARNPTQGTLKNWIYNLDPTKVHEVESAFMLMAIYRISKTKGVKYSGWGSMEGELEESDCEHVSFHRGMAKKNGARIRLWPVVYCQAAEGFDKHHTDMDESIGSLPKGVQAGQGSAAAIAAPPVEENKEIKKGHFNLVKRETGNKPKRMLRITEDVKDPPQQPKQQMDPELARAIEQINLANTTINTNNIVWSRNWHKVANSCPSVPESYYNDSTAKVQSIKDLTSYFKGCVGGGILWLRSGSTIRISDISTFIDHVLPQMTKAFTLVTSDGDISVPSRIQNAKKLLDSPLLLKWYTQNCDGCDPGSHHYHPKLRPIPIGLDLHSRRDDAESALDVSSPDTIVRHMLGLRSLKRSRDATLLIPPWNKATSGERSRAENAVQCIPHEKKEGRLPIDAVWDLFSRYKVGLAPRGNGWDTHRCWEMLLSGMIPVVKTGPLDSLYSGLPVIIVQDWYDLCKENFIQDKISALPTSFAADGVFTLQHWIKEGGAADRGNPNVPAQQQVVSVTERGQLCSDLESGKQYKAISIDKCFEGAFSGIGNGLMEYYSIVLVGLAAGIDIINGCVDATKIQAQLGMDTTAQEYPADISWREACDMSSCVLPQYPGTCPNHINKLSQLIRRDFQSFAEIWHKQHTSMEVDDIAIHWRCGDILVFSMSEYAFVKYESYVKAIDSSGAKSIGIITAPLDKERCRKNDCQTLEKCQDLLEDLVSFLRSRFPEMSVKIRNGKEEDFQSSFSRMVRADRVICGPSTFCVLPAISTMGEAFIVKSDRLYPWTNEVASSQTNVRILSDPFIVSTEARVMPINDLKAKLREAL